MYKGETSQYLYYCTDGQLSLNKVLFSLYITPLSEVIGIHPNIKFHFYADETQLVIFVSHKNAALAFDKLNSCLLDVEESMYAQMKP